MPDQPSSSRLSRRWILPAAFAAAILLAGLLLSRPAAPVAAPTPAPTRVQPEPTAPASLGVTATPAPSATVCGPTQCPTPAAAPGASACAPDAAPILDTGDVYFIGQDIPVAVEARSDAVDYALAWIVVDADGAVGATYAGTGCVADAPGAGRVAFLPTSMITRKGAYYLSGTGIARRRVLLLDPLPRVADATTWPFGLITSIDQIDRGAAMAEEFYRVGIKWFHFDYPIGDAFYMDWPLSVNAIGASGDPEAGRITPGFEAFIDRAAELGINPIFKLMNHYSDIAQPDNLDGPFYRGLRKIQTHYKGKLKYWTIGNEVEGGGYSQFTPEEYANTIRNMSIALKGVDPEVKIIAGEFYDAFNQHLDWLIRPAFRGYWDILSGHNVVRVGSGNAPVSAYLANLDGVSKPVWDTEANGTTFGGPSEWSNYMQSRFPVVYDEDLHSRIAKHMIRAFCLETRSGDRWLPAFYDPGQPCLGAGLFIGMHYNANWETQWALRRHWINSMEQPSEQNDKVAAFRAATDMLYGARGLTRIPNTDVPDPYAASPTATYQRADGYIYQHGPEIMVMLWQNSGDSRQDRELALSTDDPVVLYDSLGNAYPLRNDDGRVKVWVHPDVNYLRGFTRIPRFALDQTGDDPPYFVTAPITQAVAGQVYTYLASAYDSDVPEAGADSLPRIDIALDQAPAGMQIESTPDGQPTGGAALLTWTPETPGRYEVTLRATSRQGREQTADQSFRVEVLPAGVNLPPRILSQPTTIFGRVGRVWWYNVNAHDPNGDRVTYHLDEAPDGMTLDPDTGFVQWTPPSPGAFRLTIAASDGRASAAQTLTIRAGE